MGPEIRKEKAIELLQQLNIYNPYIIGFKAKKQKVCYFEQFGGFWVYQQPEIEKKMKELETEYNITIYAITHEYTSFGECWSFLYVSNHKYEWDEHVVPMGIKGGFYADAYVWNKDDDICSEFGQIGIQAFGGGIRRVF